VVVREGAALGAGGVAVPASLPQLTDCIRSEFGVSVSQCRVPSSVRGLTTSPAPVDGEAGVSARSWLQRGTIAPCTVKS
jgi:hypothetical protein